MNNVLIAGARDTGIGGSIKSELESREDDVMTTTTDGDPTRKDPNCENLTGPYQLKLGNTVTSEQIQAICNDISKPLSALILATSAKPIKEMEAAMKLTLNEHNVPPTTNQIAFLQYELKEIERLHNECKDDKGLLRLRIQDVLNSVNGRIQNKLKIYHKIHDFLLYDNHTPQPEVLVFDEKFQKMLELEEEINLEHNRGEYSALLNYIQTEIDELNRNLVIFAPICEIIADAPFAFYEQLKEKGKINEDSVVVYMSYDSKGPSYAPQNAKRGGEKYIADEHEKTGNAYSYRAKEMYTFSSKILPLTSLAVIANFYETYQNKEDSLFWVPLIKYLKATPKFEHYLKSAHNILQFFEDNPILFELPGEDFIKIIDKLIEGEDLRIGFIKSYAQIISETLKEQAAYEVSEIVHNTREVIEKLQIDSDNNPSLLQGGRLTPSEPEYPSKLPISQEELQELEVSDYFGVFRTVDVKENMYVLDDHNNPVLFDHMGFNPGVAGMELLFDTYPELKQKLLNGETIEVNFREDTIQPLTKLNTAKVLLDGGKETFALQDLDGAIYVEIPNKEVKKVVPKITLIDPKQETKIHDTEEVAKILPHTGEFILTDEIKHQCVSEGKKNKDVIEASLTLRDTIAHNIDATASGNVRASLLCEIAAQSTAAGVMAGKFSEVRLTKMIFQQDDSEAISKLKSGDQLVAKATTRMIRGVTHIVDVQVLKREVSDEDENEVLISLLSGTATAKVW